MGFGTASLMKRASSPTFPGGTFWEALAAVRVRDGNAADGDVVGELNKGDFVLVLAQDGDWCKVQNIWDAKPTAWLMFQNKKGKQMAEPAGDQAGAQANWTKQMECMVGWWRWVIG
jgi:hypothetical protein